MSSQGGLLRLSLRLLWQEARRGELFIIGLSIVLAVTAVYSLAGFSSRLQSAIEARTSHFLAADRILKSGHPIDPALFEDLLTDSIDTAELLQFRSMVYAGDQHLIANIKSVQGPYPLRGELMVSPWSADPPEASAAPAAVSRQGPPPEGKVWVDGRLPEALGLQPGDRIELGNSRFEIEGLIVSMPDASFNVFRYGPGVIMNHRDIEDSGLVLPGGRFSWRILFAAAPDDLARLDDQLVPRLAANQEWEDIREGDSPLARALQRAEQFLLLASLLGIILAATAIAVAARRYGERHHDPVAVLKTLGFARRDIATIYGLQLMVISGCGIGLGLLAGKGLQELALLWIGGSIEVPIPEPGLRPLLMAVATGVLCATLFSWLPMRRLLDISPMRVIRHDTAPSDTRWALSVASSGAALFLLTWLFSGEALLSFSLFAGAVLVGLILFLSSFVLIWSGRRVTRGQGGAIKLAMANLYQGGQATLVQILSFALGLMLLITIIVLRSELIDEWQAQLPPGTPNHFLVNVSPAEVEAVTRLLEDRGIPTSDLYPMSRGRLVKVDGEVIQGPASKDEAGAGDRDRRGIDRELNLTWRAELPPTNTLTAGSWWTTGSPASPPRVSVESQIAERLGITLGSELEFLLGGISRKAQVSSIREVDWASMQPNFYFIFEPGSLDDLPFSYIGAFHLAADQKSVLNALLRAFPTVTVLEVDELIKRIQAIIQQVSLALQYIMILVVFAALLVLLAQVQASFDSRRQALVILRTLGASGSYLRRSVQAEFLLMGLFSGILAGLAAEVTLWIVQTQILEMEARLHWQLWLIAAVSGALGVGIAGRIACRSLLRRNTLQQIRLLN